MHLVALNKVLNISGGRFMLRRLEGTKKYGAQLLSSISCESEGPALNLQTIEGKETLRTWNLANLRSFYIRLMWLQDVNLNSILEKFSFPILQCNLDMGLCNIDLNDVKKYTRF